jgi:hypothetical protein
MVIISFSRDRIRENIKITKTNSVDTPKPPICLQDGGNECWTFGVEIDGPSDVIYEQGGEPSMWVEATSKISCVHAPVDNSPRRKKGRYVFVRLAWLGQDLPVIRELSWADGTWKTRCAFRVHLNGPSVIEYTTKKPIYGNSKGEGVRLWMRTESEVKSENWYPNNKTECQKRLASQRGRHPSE